jgi:hypothetical protein
MVTATTFVEVVARVWLDFFLLSLVTQHTRKLKLLAVAQPLGCL